MMSESIRVPRAEPWAATAGCGVVIGLALLALGGGIIALSVSHGDYGLPAIVGGGFAITGLFVLYGGIHQLLASASPETVFEIAALPIERGRRCAGLIVQEGPLDLRSLRVNLVCLEITTRIVQRRNSTERSRTTKQVWDTNLLDAGATTVLAGERLQWDVEIEVPRDAMPSGMRDEKRAVEWRVEVWGRVRRRPDFMHPFVVEVR